ncbi:antirestriction protein ArdA [Mycobacteroides chelonae]|uniref:antirestriction protein ArdA n=1 Tax=Mycobacteroides chelonae TaxID=1774 RepID=UPI0018B0D6B1|nr:antirestriction protein ArdA [Mycobacteroides chelonae]MBF9328456.1 antirestriction protein ArdA [Mycobacteroides chelonae]MBF9422634.1 antirestriction protein ArdA [Mycobacteroides chelonae]
MHDKHTHPPQPDNRTDFIALPDSETEPALAPAIYIASLADYNNGTLHGRWIDAAREPEAIYADITAMLAQSREENAEEFAIHDYEQFGNCRINEFDSIEKVSRIARGIKEHGEAFAAWADIHESEPERLDDFSDAYLGQYQSAQDFAEQMADDLGYTDELAKLPESLRPYVHLDSTALAQDMELAGDIHVAPGPPGSVWIFDSRA